MVVVHTYTIVSNDWTVIHNQLSWEEAKAIAGKMPGSLILTVKNNCISAVRSTFIEDHYGVLSVETRHIEKVIINKHPHPSLI